MSDQGSNEGFSDEASKRAAKAGQRHARDQQWTAAAKAGDRQAFGRLVEAWLDPGYDRVTQFGVPTDGRQGTLSGAFEDVRTELELGADAAFPSLFVRSLIIRTGPPKQRKSSGDAEAEHRAADRLTRGTDLRAVATDATVAGLLWESAIVLGPETRDVLDLHWRHGLDAEEISDAIEIPADRISSMIRKLPQGFGNVVRARVLWAGGHPRNKDLGEALKAAGCKRFDASTVRVIHAHVKDNAVTRAQSLIALSPAEIFAQIPIVSAPIGVRRDVIVAATGGGSGAAIAAADAGKANPDSPYLIGNETKTAGGAAAAATAGASIAVARIAKKDADKKDGAKTDATTPAEAETSGETTTDTSADATKPSDTAEASARDEKSGAKAAGPSSGAAAAGIAAAGGVGAAAGAATTGAATSPPPVVPTAPRTAGASGSGPVHAPATRTVDEDEEAAKKKKLLIIGGIAAAFVLLAGLAFALTRGGGSGGEVDTASPSTVRSEKVASTTTPSTATTTTAEATTTTAVEEVTTTVAGIIVAPTVPPTAPPTPTTAPPPPPSNFTWSATFTVDGKTSSNNIPTGYSPGGVRLSWTSSATQPVTAKLKGPGVGSEDVSPSGSANLCPTGATGGPCNAAPGSYSYELSFYINGALKAVQTYTVSIT